MARRSNHTRATAQIDHAFAKIAAAIDHLSEGQSAESLATVRKQIEDGLDEGSAALIDLQDRVVTLSNTLLTGI